MVQLCDGLVVTCRNQNDIGPRQAYTPEQWREIHVIADSGSQSPVHCLLRGRAARSVDADHRFDARYWMSLHIREFNLSSRINEYSLVLKRFRIGWPVDADAHQKIHLLLARYLAGA